MDAGTFKVTYSDGREKSLLVQPMLADLVALERTYKISAQQISDPGAPMEWIAFLIWRIEKRAGEGRSFDDWLETVADFEPPEEAAVDPTTPAQELEPQPA